MSRGPKDVRLGNAGRSNLGVRAVEVCHVVNAIDIVRV